MTAAVRRVAAHGRDRAARWLAIVRLVPRAGWPVVAASIGLNLALGALPLAFIVATSVMLDRVTAPAAVESGQIPAAALAAFGLAIAALGVQHALAPAQAALGELVTRRVDGYCARRLITASLADAPMVLLERQDVLDKLSDARAALVEQDMTPGSAVAGLLALVSRYTQVVGAAVLVGVVLGPVAAVVVAGCAVVARFGNRGSLARWAAVVAGLGGPRRRMRYIADTGSDPVVAKEMRVLGLLPWWRARTRAEVAAYLYPLWSERRRIYFAPFLGFTAAALAGAVVVMFLLRAAAGDPGFSVLELSIAIQAITIPIRFGVFFPESDVQTQYGMYAYETIVGLERRFAAAAAPTGQGTAPAGAISHHQRQPGLPADGMPKHSIRFEGVRFAYPGSERGVLADLDLELVAGQSTAIVGLNGAGKTTLVKLLAGLYQPDAGRILVDGVDVRELDIRAWQRRLAVIFQDYVRFELDAAANIGLGAPERMADEAALRSAAERAGASGLLAALPAGLATPLSARYAGGVDLSGGQWQRIALARALFAVEGGARVLVLDEPTAQLDVRAEVELFDRFLEITRGLTTVVISHRFSTVRRADRIVVLAGGRVTEDGSHDELVRGGGRYAELFQLQARRFAEDAIA
jgi:ATP-binding cassette subfamily B protein